MSTRSLVPSSVASSSHGVGARPSWRVLAVAGTLAAVFAGGCFAQIADESEAIGIDSADLVAGDPGGIPVDETDASEVTGEGSDPLGEGVVSANGDPFDPHPDPWRATANAVAGADEEVDGDGQTPSGHQSGDGPVTNGLR